MSSGDSASEGAGDLPLVASVVPLVPAWRVDRDFDYLVPDGLDVHAGSLVRVTFGHRKVRGIVREVARRAPERPLEEIVALVLPQPLLVPPQDRIFDFLAERYIVPKGRAFARAAPARVRVRVLQPSPRPEVRPSPTALLALEGGDRLADSLRRGAAGIWCVQALPGEGRARLVTEIAALATGQVLVGVPEVRYGSPVLDALDAAGLRVARVDVTQPDAARARSWLLLAAGHAVGGGGRSAVLAPAPKLSAIVLDDEHDASYKEDRAPRYDARRIAEARAGVQGAACVFVTATPSVELAGRAARGEVGWVGPRREEERARRPIVELVTPEAERTVTRELHRRIRDALRAGKRVGLLAPRTGFARAVWCSGCRRSLRCPRCEAGLFLERGRRRVRCPRCALVEPSPDVCRYCGAADFRYLGAGSERLAGQVAASFPRARVVRVDPEVLAGPGAPGADDGDIYVATWVGMKEALRPRVALVGVLAVDHLVRRPDWRAAERAYQALAEMAEWAGPGGRLIVQTEEPRHHAVQAVVRGDYRYFAERELEARRELAYPPFSELLKCRASGPEARALIDEAAERCRHAGARVLGPVPVPAPGEAAGDGAPLEILAKCRDATDVARALRGLAASVRPGTRLRFDVDPR